MRWSHTVGALGVVLSLGLGTAWALGAAGELDTAFGTGGAEVVRDLTDAAFDVDARYVASGTVDGEICTVFARQNGPPGTTTSWAVTRHLADGSLDTAFGTAGEVVLFDGAGLSAPGSKVLASDHYTHSLAVDPDGKVLLVGLRTEKGKGKRVNDSRVLVRLDTDGSLDDTFGDGGIVDLGTWDVSALALEATTGGYEIVIGATDDITSSGGGGKTKGKKGDGSTSTSRGLSVLRYNDAGALLDSFSDGFGAGDDFRTIDIALDSAGRIVVQAYSSGDRTLSRYDDLGVLDTTFGSGGRVVIEDSDGNSAYRAYMTVDGADRVVVSGWSTGGTTLLRRHDDALSDDLPLPNDWTFLEAQAGPVAVDSQGRVSVSLWVGPDSNHDVAVARYTTAGLLDADFGTGGLSESFDDGDRDRPGPIAIDDDDGVVGALIGQQHGAAWYVRDVMVRWLGS